MSTTDDTLTTALHVQGTPAYARALVLAAKKDGYNNMSKWVDFVLCTHVLTRHGYKLPPRARAHGRPRKVATEAPAPPRPRGRPRKDAVDPKTL